MASHPRHLRCVVWQYDVQVTVGGVLCSISDIYADAGSYWALLPSFDYDPAVAYDLVVYNDGGNVTFIGAVQFISTPTLISIDPCVDRGEEYLTWSVDVQCPVGSTITLRGSLIPAAGAILVQYTVGGGFSPSVTVELVDVTRINSTTVTATLPPLDSDTAAAVYGVEGNLQLVFGSSGNTTTTNTISTRLYLLPSAPSVTYVTSRMCDSVSALQLANCSALASITIAGSNLAPTNALLLATSIGSVSYGFNFLLRQTNESESNWYDTLTNTSLVFTLDYFDADTNVQLQPDVVYTIILVASDFSSGSASNAFRLSLTYTAAVVPTPAPSSSGTAFVATSTAPAAVTVAAAITAPATSTASSSALPSSSQLSSGAIAGIVVAAVVVAVLLVLTVMWLWCYRVSGVSTSWWNKQPADDDAQRSMQGGGASSSDAYTDVELH